jgi:alpha-ketoglutarate-dependent taurine dioxygenase
MDVSPLDASFGATVTGVKLTDIDDETFRRLYDTWLQYSLLIFPGQHFDNAQQIAFARRFGALEPKLELYEFSNIKEDGSLRTGTEDDMIKVLKGNMSWHQDSTYMPVQAKGAVFRADVVPSSGGETGWADMAAAYDALNDPMRERVERLSAHHSLVHSQRKVGFTHKEEDSEYMGYGMDQAGAPLRPIVKTHSETGRKSLTIGRHAYGVSGLADDESRALLDELVDFACRAPRIYHHNWTPGDAVVWDNRCLMHQACPWDMNEPRVTFHTRLAGDPVHEFAAVG